MPRRNVTMLLYLLLVFVSGVVVGGFGNRLYMMKPTAAPRSRADFRKQYIQEMRTRLRLTDPQVSELQQIMQSTDVRFRDLHKSIEDEHVRKIVAMLNDSQRAEYTRMREERERHRQQSEQKGL